MERVGIKYVEGAKRLEAIPVGDWLDLRARETVELEAGDYSLIPLGIMTELPEGYEAHVAARSSTFGKWGIMNPAGIGIIDNGYRGEWRFPALAFRPTTVHAGDRICQFRIVPSQGRVVLEERGELGETARGDGGFGSTGHE